MTTISLKVPETLDFRLAQIAKKNGSSKSEMIRDALEHMVATRHTRKCSCLSMASDLIGCVDGSADLSRNKKRMKGFGT
ncbi:MAG: ribbon-helix-helix protein, CopG family [Victivallales bacterium]